MTLRIFLEERTFLSQRILKDNINKASCLLLILSLIVLFQSISFFQVSTIKTTLTHLSTPATNSTAGSDLLPPLCNPPLLEAAEDLTNLSYLNEPAGKFYFSLSFHVELY